MNDREGYIIISSPQATSKLTAKGHDIDSVLKEAIEITKEKREELRKNFRDFDVGKLSAEDLKNIMGYEGNPKYWSSSTECRRQMSGAFSTYSSEITELEEALTMLRRCLRRKHSLTSLDDMTTQVIDTLYGAI